MQGELADGDIERFSSVVRLDIAAVRGFGLVWEDGEETYDTGGENGSPRLMPRDVSGMPDRQVLEAARYLDAMNYAMRTK